MVSIGADVIDVGHRRTALEELVSVTIRRRRRHVGSSRTIAANRVSHAVAAVH
jgi:hypothetical protein